MYGGNRNMNAFQMNNPQAQMLFLMMQQLAGGSAFGNMFKNFGFQNFNNRRNFNRGNFNNRGNRGGNQNY